jgi:effector-binding domain-containing protein
MPAPTTPSLEPEVRDLPHTTTAAVRVVRTPADLSQTFQEVLPLVAARVAELGGSIAGAPYARYHAMTAEEFDVEIGAPIVAAIAGLAELPDVPSGEVGNSSLPHGRAAVIVHTGPYATLGETWRMVPESLAGRGLTPRSPGWESYVDDPASTSPDSLRTEIIIPVA